jgi:hypothetical protein
MLLSLWRLEGGLSAKSHKVSFQLVEKLFPFEVRDMRGYSSGVRVTP